MNAFLVFIKSIVCLGLILLLTVGLNWVKAQDSTGFKRISFEIGAGFIIPHSNSIAEISNYRPISFQLSYTKILLSEEASQSCSCAPLVGIIGLHHRYGNPEMLGSGSGVIAIVQPMFGIEKKWSYGFRLAGGPVYLNRLYHPQDNPNNLFFSSSISMLLQGGIELQYRPKDHWGITGNVIYNHISNGGLKEPNKGMNYPSILLGLVYYPKSLELMTYKSNTQSWKNDRPWGASVSGIYTARSTGDITAKRLHVYGLDASVHYRHGVLRESRVGAEYVADPVRRIEARERGESVSNHHVGIHAGEYLVAGRFSLGLALGVYIWNRDPAKDPVYQRYQLSVDVHSKIRLSMTLRAHRSVADFADLRIAYLF